MERAVVVTANVAVAGVLPFSVTEEGEGVQLPAGGAPVQVSATIPLKPPTGVNVRV